jgi:RNA polymerase sigma-70 factor (ECF subfamily)
MDEHAFYSFYAGTARALRAYVARVLGDAGQVDDIVQESYLKLLRLPMAPEDPRQLRPLLFRIASNLVTDEWRRRRRATNAADAHRLAPNGLPPDMVLRVDMIRVFQQLKPQQRQMMWLAYVEGADHREIAAALGLREGSVRVLLHRARRKLASLLRAVTPSGGNHGR